MSKVGPIFDSLNWKLKTIYYSKVKPIANVSVVMGGGGPAIERSARAGSHPNCRPTRGSADDLAVELAAMFPFRGRIFVFGILKYDFNNI